jgi:predicted phage terminase large subunit-like protein
MTCEQAVKFLRDNPYKFGHLVGFTKLTELHNKWIVDMVRGKEDKTLQAHRGSYKTTCVSIALALIIVLLPNLRTLFMRKTDTDIKEIVSQVKKILLSEQMRYFVKSIYGVNIELTTATANEISTNLTNDPRGTSQLVGIGMGSSITGKHFDRIFTDDIVNVADRTSKAERDKTKIAYQELQNIKNRGGRIFNTGTPWHKEDAFMLMPNPEKYDCYSTGLISTEEIEKLKSGMTSSLFAANYELRHIAAEDVIFDYPKTGYDPALAEQGICHVDAAYGGEDYTAFTICNKKGDKYYMLGKLWRKHVDDCENEIIKLRAAFNAGKIYCEDNGDKGYLAKDLRKRGEMVGNYHESMNKFLKITSYLKAEWENVYFVAGTDQEYIDQICDYNENAEHDDAPDSAASIVRKLWKKQSDDKMPTWMMGR